MEEYISAVASCSLFDGIAQQDIQKLISCAGARIRHYKKHDIIIQQAERHCEAGIVLQGEAEAYRLNGDGTRIFMASFAQGMVFGDVLMFAEKENSPVSVRAVTEIQVLEIDSRKLVSLCKCACEPHLKVIDNIFAVISEKFIQQRRQLMIMSMKTLRAKIASALIHFSNGSQGTFNIPFDRAAFADYLGADRSALSRELSKLRLEGSIEFYKNSFKIIDRDKLAG